MRVKINYLLAELVVIFTLLPAIIHLSDSRNVMIGLLWVGGLLSWYILSLESNFSMRKEWNWAQVNRTTLKPILIRFVPIAILLLIFVILEIPDKFFRFPIERPILWLMVMVLYPILSVIPQSLIYRSLFFHRYEKTLDDPIRSCVISGLAFGYAHFFLGNVIAVILCMIGGTIFAHNYMRNRSLALVSIEHSLYGCYIFTLGLGKYFYSGTHLHS